jgi:hypothetical protein
VKHTDAVIVEPAILIITHREAEAGGWRLFEGIDDSEDVKMCVSFCATSAAFVAPPPVANFSDTMTSLGLILGNKLSI